jgi:hypothetical protein
VTLLRHARRPKTVGQKGLADTRGHGTGMPGLSATHIVCVCLPSYGDAAWNSSTPNEIIDVGGGLRSGPVGTEQKCTEAYCF